MGLKKIWENRKKILEGITNSVFKQEHIEEIAKERMAICEACPLIDREGKSCEGGTICRPCCSSCGCKLSFKTRSLASSCPHPDGPKWEAVLDQEEEDTLYKKIEYEPGESSK